MAKKKQKKKRNKEYILKVEKPCMCGSGNKFKDCCKPFTRNGPLLKQADNRFNDIHTIILFEINSILKNMCLESKFLDKMFSSFLDMFSLSDEALKSCKKHVYDLKDNIGTHKNENTYVVEDFDHKINFYIRFLYISGGVVKDTLTRFANELGFNISFLFGEENDKKFNSKLDKLIKKFEDKDSALRLKDFILENKKDWLGSFIKNRNNIEHGEFKINSIEYLVNKNDKLLPQFPLIDGLTCNELFRKYPVKFFHFSREIIIFLLNELSYKEEFMGGSCRGIIVPVKEKNMPFGVLNKEKIIYKFTTINKKTNQILTTNFSRNCIKK